MSPINKQHALVNEWTDERLAALREMWSAGVSGPKIAEALGVSRGSVAGKIHRLKNATSHSGTVNTKKRVKPAVRRKMAHACASPDEPANPKTLLELGPDDCRWPEGDPRSPAFRFCGRRTVCRPYCQQHAKRAYTQTGGAA